MALQSKDEAQAPSTMCCVLSDHEIPAIVAAFAVVIAEHAYTPLSTTDPVELLKRRMSLSGARIILASRENLDLAAELSDNDITIICIEDQWERCAEQMPSGCRFQSRSACLSVFYVGFVGRSQGCHPLPRQFTAKCGVLSRGYTIITRPQCEPVDESGVYTIGILPFWRTPHRRHAISVESGQKGRRRALGLGVARRDHPHLHHPDSLSPLVVFVRRTLVSVPGENGDAGG